MLLPWAAVISAPRGTGVSGIPVLGGGLAAIGLAIIPSVPAWLIILPLVVDPSCLPLLVWWLATRRDTR